MRIATVLVRVFVGESAAQWEHNSWMDGQQVVDMPCGMFVYVCGVLDFFLLVSHRMRMRVARIQNACNKAKVESTAAFLRGVHTRIVIKLIQWRTWRMHFLRSTQMDIDYTPS